MEKLGNPLERIDRELVEIEKKLSAIYGIDRDDLRNVAYARGLYYILNNSESLAIKEPRRDAGIVKRLLRKKLQQMLEPESAR